MRIKLEDVVMGIRQEVVDAKKRSYRFIAENKQGNTIRVNPFLYKKLEGLRLNGSPIYKLVEK